MTLEEKVGQLFLLAFETSDIDAAQTLFERYFVGGSYLSNDNLPDPAAATAMTARIQGFASFYLACGSITANGQYLPGLILRHGKA